MQTLFMINISFVRFDLQRKFCINSKTNEQIFTNTSMNKFIEELSSQEIKII